MAKVEIRLRCFNLPALDFFSKSDPLIIAYTKIEGEEDKWEKLDQTECIPNNLAPVFAKVMTLDWNVKTELKFEVLDMDDKKLDDFSKAHYIGHYLVSLADLVCIGGATGRKHLRWKNGNVLTHGSISVHATVVGGDTAAVLAEAKEYAEADALRKACTLYWSPHCPASLAVVAVVKTELLKEVRLQQVSKGQTVESNPSGVLPFLDDVGFRLHGANTILRYLCQKYLFVSPTLYPSDLQGRAKVEQALDWHLTNTARGWPFLAPRFGASVEQSAQDEGKTWVDSSLTEVESILGKQNFLAGGSITLADVVTFMEIALLPDSFTGSLPNVTRWLQAMAAYDSFVAEAKQVMS